MLWSYDTFWKILGEEKTITGVKYKCIHN